MFLKSLRIENSGGIIRDIQFNAGLNLIVDETPTDQLESTGNNVGKTTVLRLIDVCLGGDPRRVFTDPENQKSEYAQVKSFLIDTRVLVTLTLRKSLVAESSNDLVIERNFLPRNQLIRRINGRSFSEDEFSLYLRTHLFPEDAGTKPTFRQIISHNIRYREPAVSNTLRTLDGFTRKDEYEVLYLFLLGAAFKHGDRKQELTTRLRTETAFKQRLEGKQTKAEFEISLNLLLDEIKDLEARRAAFKHSSEVDSQISRLGEIKYQKGAIASELARLKLRHDLAREAVTDVRAQRSQVDVGELRKLYSEVSGHLNGLTKTFDDLVSFHNRMVEEKVRYIAKDLPRLEEKVLEKEAELRQINRAEAELVEVVSSSGGFEDMEAVVLTLNDRHRRRGELEVVIEQLSVVEDAIAEVRNELSDLDRELFSEESSASVYAQIRKFNKHFAAVSQELYGEKYALKVERGSSRTGGQIFEFSCFSTNFSTGKKQGEITCFDIAYTLFADEEQIPCYHFLLNDKKELMHDNQLERIGRLVERKSEHVQFVASILRDKLPPWLNSEEFFVVKLSQTDKLFRIEGGGRDPEHSAD